MLHFSGARFFALLDASKGLGNFFLWFFLSFSMYYRIWEYTLVRYLWAARPQAHLHPVVYLLLSILFSPLLAIILVTSVLILPELEVDLLPAFLCNAVAENLGTAYGITLTISITVSVLLINRVARDMERTLTEHGIPCHFNRWWVSLFQSFYLRSKLHALYVQQPEQEKTAKLPFDEKELFAMLDSHISLLRSIMYCFITFGMYTFLWLYMFVKYMDVSSESTRQRFFTFLLVFEWGFMLRYALPEDTELLGFFTLGDVYTIFLVVFLLVQFVAKAANETKELLQQKGIPVKFNIVLQVIFSAFYYHCKFHNIYKALRQAQPAAAR